MIITSKSNQRYKQIESLKMKKYRFLYQQYVVEGINPVQDAIHAHAPIVSIAVSETFYRERGMDDFSCYTVDIFSDSLFHAISCTKTPQGVLACVAMEEKTLPQKEDAFYLFCDGISDPGNAGTIIRLADACGCDAVLFSENSVDIYSDKTIRASMGSFFHLPVMHHVSAEWLAEKKREHFRIVGGILSADSVAYTNVAMRFPLIIVVGNEANGISAAVQALCTDQAIIPIYGKAESLNVGVAAAVMCYEARRQNESERELWTKKLNEN